MFYGAVSDFFAQAVISFLLGHRNLSVFSEFLETLTSTDAASVVKLSRIRSVASAYILSTLQENYGFLINFSPTNESTRYSTYSLRNKLPSPAESTPETPVAEVEHANINPDLTEYFAFKAMPGHTGNEGSCQELVNNAVNQISEVCKRDDLVIEQDIVSLVEAASSTSILDKMDYAFKRFLWL
ncbi:uncharacterized protein IL334_007819 [Kwoniella shivajii]|uniref:RNase H type-1 domain-containing protein n=1 Tax=Kwoniella shivajii TaxID=564305 RepID=A0ABZ1DBU6_9TREE|nr:hypothetical protein IL334_007819 [Kwoniella shivajii]